jgi:hypothetical protein
MVFSLGGGGSGEPKSIPELGALVLSICCSMMVVMGVMNMPFKTPPMLLAACCCSSSCSTSTSALLEDILLRVKTLNKKDEAEEA